MGRSPGFLSRGPWSKSLGFSRFPLSHLGMEIKSVTSKHASCFTVYHLPGEVRAGFRAQGCTIMRDSRRLGTSVGRFEESLRDHSQGSEVTGNDESTEGMKSL